MHIEGAPLPLDPLEEEAVLTALLGGLGGEEGGVEVEGLSRVELCGAVVEEDIHEGDHSAAGNVRAHVLVILVALTAEFLEVPASINS